MSEPLPNQESVLFGLARFGGIRPRPPRATELPPIYPPCPRCGAEAPPARVMRRHVPCPEQRISLSEGDGLVLVNACLRCVARLVAGM